MHYLAIDLGDKRTGVAVGDDQSRIVTPLQVVVTASGPERLRRLCRLIQEHGPDAVVLGLPLNMDGSAGPAAAKARAVGQTLHRQTGVRLIEVDERLTSAAADEQMARIGLTHGQKKARRDALAAAVILQRYFEVLDADADADAEPGSDQASSQP
jgi:putative Holliday junction resolvase